MNPWIGLIYCHEISFFLLSFTLKMFSTKRPWEGSRHKADNSNWNPLFFLLLCKSIMLKLAMIWGSSNNQTNSFPLMYCCLRPLDLHTTFLFDISWQSLQLCQYSVYTVVLLLKALIFLGHWGVLSLDSHLFNITKYISLRMKTQPRTSISCFYQLQILS